MLVGKRVMMIKQGFTLVELSVVIIIIGLILAGITKGAELIKSAQLSRYASELQTYAAAYQGFVSIYRCVPGDCANAEGYFGADNTNNGNGNGIIQWSSTENERYLAWNHLGLAELVPGEFTFAAAVGGGTYLAGENIPASVISGLGYMMYSEPGGILGLSIPGTVFNTILIGNRRTDGVYHAAHLNASEAYSVDVKIDDGIPSSGYLMTGRGYDNSTTSWYSSGCINIIVAGTEYEYDFSNNVESCRQVYFLNKWR